MLKVVFGFILIFLLFDCGFSNSLDTKFNQAYSLVSKGDFSKASDFFEKNPDFNINTFNQSGETLLEISIHKNDLKSFEWLLKNGASPNILTKERTESAMKLAAENKNSEYLIQAIKYKGDVNLSHRFGENPLYFAAVSGQEKNIDILIANKGDALILDKYQNNTFTCLIISNKFKAFNLLISKDCKPLNVNTDVLKRMVYNLETSYGNLTKEANEEFIKVVKYFNDQNIKVELLSLNDYMKKYNK